jgi:hypothetical protein
VEDVRGGVEAEVSQEVVFLAEDQAAHGRVDPVRPDQQVGLEGAAVAERDPHPVGGVVDRVQAGGEPQVDVVGELLAQRLLKVGSQDAEQPTLDDLAELVEPQPGAAPSGVVEPARLLKPVSKLAQSGQHPHGFGGVIARPKEVDHVALGSRAGRFLQHHDLPAERIESLGQGEPGDAGPADDDLHGG